MWNIFKRSKTPPFDRAIKDRATRSQQRWFDDATARVKRVVVPVPREVESRLAQLDALDEMDCF